MSSDAQPDVACRHLILCRTIWYDAGNPDEGYSLGRVVVTLRSGETDEELVLPRLFAFIQLFGEPAEYDVRIRLFRVDRGEDDDLTEVAAWGPWPYEVTGFELVESRGVELRRVPFPEPGLYEFQVWIDGQTNAAGWERVEVRAEVRE